MAAVKKSKNQLRRERLKQKKQAPAAEPTTPSNDDITSITKAKDTEPPKTVERKKIESITPIEIDTEAPSGKIFHSEFDTLLEKPEFAQFKHVFDKFHMEEPQEGPHSKGDIIESDDDQHMLNGGESEDEVNKQPEMSKKKQRKANKMPLAELKANAKYPELVQWYDVDAADPMLVVEIKSKKNYVPVPAHWQFKREYLSGRRAIEKKPFTLPKFISETGITDMRDTTQDDESNMKQRMREKVQPKMNRLDLDYQKLYDAFFRFQTKPRLLGFGDVYFEGREAEELDLTKYKPGVISDELREALGIPKGITLPWVQKMNHFGPPPSYPDLKIPGFNTDISQEIDVFGEDKNIFNASNVETEPFGKLISYEDSEEEDESEEEEQEEELEEEMEEEEAAAYLSDSEIKQAAAGIENGDEQAPTYEGEEDGDEEDVSLAEVKATEEEQEEEPQPSKQLYHVIKESEQADSGLLSSKRAYDLSEVNGNNKSEFTEPTTKKQKKESPKTKPINTSNDKDEEADDDDDDDDEAGGKFRF